MHNVSYSHKAMNSSILPERLKQPIAECTSTIAIALHTVLPSFLPPLHSTATLRRQFRREFFRSFASLVNLPINTTVPP
jgi:hypothetical protein